MIRLLGIVAVLSISTIHAKPQPVGVLPPGSESVRTLKTALDHPAVAQALSNQPLRAITYSPAIARIQGQNQAGFHIVTSTRYIDVVSQCARIQPPVVGPCLLEVRVHQQGPLNDVPVPMPNNN